MVDVLEANMQSAIDGVIADGTPLRKVVTGFTFTEGPIYHPDTGRLYFSDIAESKQYVWDKTSGLKFFRMPSNQANGNCFDLDGNIVTCEHASSHLVIHDHSGKRVRVLVSHFEGKELNSPNDVVCDTAGRLWFTDPSFGRIREDLGLVREQELDFQGLFRLDPDGTLHCMAKDFQQPNGLCFSNDESRLFVNDSWGGNIRVFTVDSDGALYGGGEWTKVTGEGEGVPDGMKMDIAGRIFCNGPGGVHVFSPSAQHLGVIRTPEKSTNFCFGGPRNTTLFITASTSVYAISTMTSANSMIHD
ncbi:MAG: SMP-30/gluconolactonase/LRE family protein [Pseudomonadota bacterium]